MGLFDINHNISLLKTDVETLKKQNEILEKQNKILENFKEVLEMKRDGLSFDDKNEYLRYSKSCKPKSWNSAYIRLYHDRVLVYEKYKEKFYG